MMHGLSRINHHELIIVDFDSFTNDPIKDLHRLESFIGKIINTNKKHEYEKIFISQRLIKSRYSMESLRTNSKVNDICYNLYKTLNSYSSTNIEPEIYIKDIEQFKIMFMELRPFFICMQNLININQNTLRKRMAYNIKKYIRHTYT